MYELRNPVDNVKRPKQKRARERRLKHNEEEKLIQELAPPYSDAVLLLHETALRRSELCRLQWQDLNLYKRTALIRDTKNGEDRIIPLSPLAAQILARQPQTHDSVFKFSPDMLTQAFRAATRQAGIRNLRLHDLRKEATSRLVESKCFELPEIMRITGHKTLTAFNVYMHIKAEELANRMANKPET